MAVPADLLTPEQLGARLVILPPSGAPPLPGVRLARDEGTGVTWWVRTGHGAGQAQLEVVAGMLYRAADLAASTWRLVVLEGQLGVAQEARVAWSPVSSSDALGGGLAADLWVGNVGGPRAARQRLLPVPGPRVLRLDLAHTLGWDGLGLRYSGVGWPRLARPPVWPDRAPLRGVTVDEIDEALAAARLEGVAAESLRATLLDRLATILA